MANENGNGQKRRRLDHETMERIAENSTVKLSSRLAMVVITAIGLPLAGYIGHRVVTQLDAVAATQSVLAKDQGDLAKGMAVIAVEVKGLDRRVRNLEWTGRRSDRDDDRPGVRQ